MTRAHTLYAIGDLQGCVAPLQRLLARLPADARLVFVGDLVNRGPDSLATLRLVRDLGQRAVALLGNHDLHLLAVAAGVRKEHRTDTLRDILQAPDRDALLDWLRARPLAHRDGSYLFVHAGLLPQWTAERAAVLAHEVEARLRARDWKTFLLTMYGNRPDCWDDALTGADRARVIINALTRLRLLTPAGAQDFDVKEGPQAAPAGYVPWYAAPRRAWRGTTVVYGHWAAQGLHRSDDAIGLDSGCVWGGCLTAMRLPDGALVQERCG